MASGSPYQAWWGGNRWGGRSWHGWQQSTGEATAGGTPPAAGGTPRRDVPEEEVVYSTWPLSEQGYPETGRHSFEELSALTDDLGCEVTVTTRCRVQPARPPTLTLTIRGFQCYAVYQAFLDAATSLGADLNKVTTTTQATQRKQECGFEGWASQRGLAAARGRAQAALRLARPGRFTRLC